ncbi:MAG: RluA family pseudouridine synthase [Kofleriaceae bacterium]
MSARASGGASAPDEVVWLDAGLSGEGASSARFPSPFAVPPHPIARHAAELLIADLRAGRLGIDARILDRPASDNDPSAGGKMFGVLVVRVPSARAERLGYLRAFSGMLAGAWSLPGFVPPLFDSAVRDSMWPAGQATLRAYEVELRALVASPAYTSAKAHLASFERELATDLAFLQERHRARRAQRKIARAGLDLDIEGVRVDESPRAVDARAVALHALDQESRADAAERKRFDAERAAERAGIAARLAALESRRVELVHLRADESRGLMKQVHDHYTITNARGEQRPLRALFAPGEPPGGAGDCAAPKLLGFAYAHGLVPIALAEVWVGASPATGGRNDGALYAACRGKCGPILPFMLDGLDHDPIVDPGASVTSAWPSGASAANAVSSASGSGRSPLPPILFEDEHLVIVEKPAGMLSVPGRSGALRDSVQTRLRSRYTDGSVVHRLDLDTSGLLTCAKDLATYKALQAMFTRRAIAKRYVAIVDGEVLSDEGTIELAMRVDLDDRPRQIVDSEYGKPATTTWRVLVRDAGRTRVELVPLTGRTHQLRVHCAHRFGLDAPIVGDRLYGTPASQHAPRLLLHAERLSFTHPITGAVVEVTSPTPF